MSLAAPHSAVLRSSFGLDEAMRAVAREVDATMEHLLPAAMGPGGRVAAAMRYAVFAGGKRLRPYLVIEGARLFGGEPEGALRVAAAIECLHTYSLVHDDLPCMDDDDERRGRPTTHRAFDEATAVLAGDALLTFAFELLAHPATHPDGGVRAELVARLAASAGAAGMVGGQMMDIEAPARGFDLDQIAVLQRMKTGALFEFSAAAGAVLAKAGAEHVARVIAFARAFGLAFQIADDLIDATGDAAEAGKAVGKDADAGKATYVSILGVEGARAQLVRLAGEAEAALESYGGAAAPLKALARHMVGRRR